MSFSSALKRTNSLFLATLLLTSQLMFAFVALPQTANAAGTISFGSQFENQTFPNDPNTWTNGQLDNYSEGDFVNFRYELTASDATGEGTMQIEFDLGSCDFFTDYFEVVSVSPAIASVEKDTQSLIPGNGPNGAFYSQNLDVEFISAGTTTIIFTLRLSNTAGECSGSNVGVRLGVPDSGAGDFANAGAKTLPMSANSVLENPSLSITKVVTSGDAVSSDFYFTVSPAINGQTEIHIPVGQTSVTIDEVNPDGQFVITEHGPIGYTFSGGTGTSCAADSSTIGTVGGKMTATVEARTSNPLNASCIFTNDIVPGKIIVEKQTNPDQDSTPFSFTSSYDDDGFTLSDGQQNDSGNLMPGTYSVSETVPSGWDLSSATCDDGSNPSSISLAANETVKCTFTNTKRATLIVQKNTLPSGDMASFPISVSTEDGEVIGTPSGSISDTESGDASFVVKPGTYNVTEDLSSLTKWAETSNTCSNVNVGAGETKYCTITNTKLGSIQVVKDAQPNHADNFEFSLGGLFDGESNFFLDDDNDLTLSNEKTFSDLLPGSYSVTEELNDENWSLTGLTCDDQSINGSTAVISLSAGQDVVCTYTNTRLIKISGTKFEANQGDIAGMPGTGLGGWEIVLDLNGDGDFNEDDQKTTTNEDGYYFFDDILFGTHVSLYEILINGWSQIFSPADFTVNSTENITDLDFGNFENGSISGYKWNDQDGDGNVDNEPRLQGWTIFIDENNNQILDDTEISDTTDENGDYLFDNLTPGTYTVCEVQQEGWTQTAPGTQTGCTSTTIDVSGESVTRNFGNQGRGTVTVLKNVDNNGDGDYGDEGETGSTNWLWDLDGDYYSSSDIATGNEALDVPAGDYDIEEDMQPNYHFVSVACTVNQQMIEVSQSEVIELSVDPGDDVVCTFVNALDTGTITIVKDAQPNSAEEFKFTGSLGDPSEEGPNFTLVDDGENPELREREFLNLPTGNYTVTEPNVKGWDLTDISCTGGDDDDEINVNNRNVVIELVKDEDITCTFTNVKHGEVIIEKDANPEDGTDFNFSITKVLEIDLPELSFDSIISESLDDGEESFMLDDDDDDTLSNQQVLSLAEGTYRITEENIPSGWRLMDIRCDEAEYYTDGATLTLYVEKGDSIHCYFENEKDAEVVVTKFNDTNRNGEFDENEDVLNDWDMTLVGEDACEQELQLERIAIIDYPCEDYEYDRTHTTGHDGNDEGETTFTEVKPYVSHNLSETLKEDWTWSNTYCNYENERAFKELIEDNNYEVYASAGETIECFIGNYADVVLTIEKSNNQPAPVSPGSSVVYTLVVTVPETSGPSYNNVVTDLPPENFAYVPGSWTANSSERGNLKTAGITTEPTYASPGDWELGDMMPGEVVTLTYQANIANDITPGIYPDVAYVLGCEEDDTCDQTVVGNVSAGESTPFVDTDVEVIVGQILGATTTRLVNTGSADALRNMLFGMALLLGVIAANLQTRQKKGAQL